jgi:hypothetical protein
MDSSNKFNQAVISTLNNHINFHYNDIKISSSFLSNLLNLTKQEIEALQKGNREFFINELQILSKYFKLHIDELLNLEEAK